MCEKFVFFLNWILLGSNGKTNSHLSFALLRFVWICNVVEDEIRKSRFWDASHSRKIDRKETSFDKKKRRHPDFRLHCKNAFVCEQNGNYELWVLKKKKRREGKP